MSTTAFTVSMLGCPGLPLDRVGALPRRHGVAGVQLRRAGDEPVHVGLGTRERRNARQLAGDGLTLTGLATYVDLSAGATGPRAHLDLAHDLGAPVVLEHEARRHSGAAPIDDAIAGAVALLRSSARL